MRKLTTMLILPFVITACGNAANDNANRGSGLERGWEVEEQGSSTSTGTVDPDGSTTEPTDPAGPTDPNDPADACAGLACGDPCDPCANGAPDCVGIGATTFCNAEGQCVPGNPQTIVCEPEPYDPCAGLTCGELCEPCDPNDPECFAIGATSVCDENGACVGGNPQTVACDTWDPCENLACGDLCEMCNPNDPDCFPIGATSVCDGNGECVGGNPQNVTCG